MTFIFLYYHNTIKSVIRSCRQYLNTGSSSNNCYSSQMTIVTLIHECERITKIPSLSIAIFPADAPSCIVLDDLAAHSSVGPEQLVITDNDAAAAAPASHTEDEAVSPSNDVWARDSDNSAHVGT